MPLSVRSLCSTIFRHVKISTLLTECPNHISLFPFFSSPLSAFIHRIGSNSTLWIVSHFEFHCSFYILKRRNVYLLTVSSFSSSEQQVMQGIIEQKQMKDFMKLYTGLVERCFDSCCNDFTSRTLSSKEVRFEIHLG